MDLLNLVLDPKISKSTCFLCFNKSDNVWSIYDDVEIKDKLFNFKLSLSNIVKYLFPSHDTILAQACNTCKDLAIQMFVVLQKNRTKKYIFRIIIDSLENAISKEIVGIERNTTECRVNIVIPSKENTDMVTILENKDIKEINEIIAECEKCKMKFTSHELLNEHEILAHKTTNKAIICETCGKVFKTPQKLKIHLNCHKKKQCPYCAKILKTHSHFKVHVKNHETTTKRQRKKTYYLCNYCNYKSLNIVSLEGHINKFHLRRRPYVCQICHKGFYNKSNLTEHVTTHRETKTETCEICGDNFVCKKTLYQHLKLHSDDRPYLCEFCDEKFITSGRRYEHVKRRHMGKTLCCLLCNNKYSLKKDLNRHMKKIHQDIVSDSIL